MARVVKRAYRCRFNPSPDQAADRSHTFGCVRKVSSLALVAS